MASTRGPERLIVSLHMPKTAGTTFAAVLEQAFPGAVAYFYKDRNPATHPLFKDRERLGDPGLLRELEESGVRVIHGHARASRFFEAVPDPKQYWTWLRDPVERMISLYYYQHQRNQRLAQLPDPQRPRDKLAGMPLWHYARRGPNRNLQSRALAGLPIEEMGFVGITERFDESLAMLGLPTIGQPEPRNANPDRPPTGGMVRNIIAQNNAVDVDLYRRALALHEQRRAALFPPVPEAAPAPKGARKAGRGGGRRRKARQASLAPGAD